MTKALLESYGVSQEELDRMVAGLNAAMVSKDERLSDHSYYYDAKMGEVRIWA